MNKLTKFVTIFITAISLVACAAPHVANKASKQELQSIQEEMEKLRKKYEKAKLGLEIAKSKKCPPAKQCLPVIDPATLSTQKKPTINDFDIRTHRDFYKYVAVENVKPCPTAEELLKGKYKDLKKHFHYSLAFVKVY